MPPLNEPMCVCVCTFVCVFVCSMYMYWYNRHTLYSTVGTMHPDGYIESMHAPERHSTPMKMT